VDKANWWWRQKNSVDIDSFAATKWSAVVKQMVMARADREGRTSPCAPEHLVVEKKGVLTQNRSKPAQLKIDMHFLGTMSSLTDSLPSEDEEEDAATLNEFQQARSSLRRTMSMNRDWDVDGDDEVGGM
jgi:hypothetical protein